MAGGFSEFVDTFPIAGVSVFLIRTRWPRAYSNRVCRNDAIMSDGGTLYALPAEWQVVLSGTNKCSNESTSSRLTDPRAEDL